MVGKYEQHFLWITDPWDTLDHSKDTTLRLAEEALTLGYASSWCDVRTIRWFDNSTLLDTYSIESISPSRQKDSFRFAGLLCLPPHRFASIQYRTDPPVDAAYIYPLQLLVIGIEKAELEGHVEREAVQIVNPPSVLLMTNEKLEQALIGDLMPLTLVATEWSQLLEFGLAERRTILKPLNDVQSHGVELLDWQTSQGIEQARDQLQRATNNFRQPVILQRYLHQILNGETRLWFLDGQLLASAKKVSRSGSYRIDMDNGDRLVASDLTEPERQASILIGDRLRAKRIRLAALDLIDGQVTDFNFMSPGLLPEFEEVLGVNLARSIVESLASAG